MRACFVLQCVAGRPGKSRHRGMPGAPQCGFLLRVVRACIETAVSRTNKENGFVNEISFS